MSELQKHHEQIREKLDDRPHLDAGLESALGAAIAGEMPEGEEGAQGADLVALAAGNERAAAVEGWRFAVMQAVPMIEAFIPEFKDKVTRDQWSEFGAALGEACVHYGLGIGEAFNHPLVKVLIAGFPIGIAGYQIKQARIAAAIQQTKQIPAARSAVSERAGDPPVQQTGSVASSPHPGVTVVAMTADKVA